MKLKKVSTDINATVENVTVSSPTYYGRGFNTLTISPNNNSVIIQSGGAADFKALDEIHVEAGFHAQYGSDVHLYCDTVNIDCNEIDVANLNFRTVGSATSENAQSKKSSLELVFRMGNKDEKISCYPNPNQGTFTLHYYGNSTQEMQIQVFDPVGNLMYQTWINGNSSVIDLSLVPKGPCFLSLSDQIHIYHQIIIIQ